jgi:predicted transcriptional regulator
MAHIQNFLTPINTLKEAINILCVSLTNKESMGTEGLPILDQSNKIIGILWIHNILESVYPFYMTMTEANLENLHGMA